MLGINIYPYLNKISGLNMVFKIYDIQILILIRFSTAKSINIHIYWLKNPTTQYEFGTFNLYLLN